MKILHFSDLHVWRLAFDFRDPAFKRFLGIANLWARRKRAFPPALSRLVAEEILRSEADAVVFSGDLTTTAHPAEFDDARGLLAPIREKWGECFFVIPGNHDRYTAKTLERGLYEKAFEHHGFEPGRPAVKSMVLNEEFALVGFDASVPRIVSSTGLFTEALAGALDEALRLQADQGRQVVLVGHFPYAAPPRVRSKRSHRLVGAERLIEVVSRRKPVLYLHGHKHRRWAFHPDGTPATLCVNSGSAGLGAKDWTTRAGFVEIDIAESGRRMTVEARVAPPAPRRGDSSASASSVGSTDSPRGGFERHLLFERRRCG